MGSSCLGPSMLLVPKYLFPSLGLEVFGHNFFKCIFYPLSSFFSFWNYYYAQIGIGLLYCFHLFKIWLSVFCSYWVISIILFSKSLILSSAFCYHSCFVLPNYDTIIVVSKNHNSRRHLSVVSIARQKIKDSHNCKP